MFDDNRASASIAWLNRIGKSVSSLRPLIYRWGKELGKKRIILNALGGLRHISEIMDTIRVEMRDISVRTNTLEDVFIDLTGRRLRN